MDEEKIEEEANDKIWLSCNSAVAGSSGSQIRKRKGPSGMRKTLVFQKKLPRLWRENDELLLTELDLIQPTGSSTKQTSLLSYFRDNEKMDLHKLPTPKCTSVEGGSISIANDLLNTNQQEMPMITMNTPEDSNGEDSSLNEANVFNSHISHSDRDRYSTGTKENSYPEKICGEANNSADDRFDLSPVARRFVSIVNRKELLSDGYSDQSHLKDGKEFPVLSLRTRLVNERDASDKLFKTCGESDRQPFPKENLVISEEETVLSELCSSQNSLKDSDDDNPSFCDNGDKYRESKKSSPPRTNESDNSVASRRKCASFPEESLSFTPEECNTHLLNVPLSGSQRARKEVYKAEMGTLHFSQSTPFS